MNAQVEQLIDGVYCHHKRAMFFAIDEAISILYIHGYLPPSQMKKARNKLVATLQREQPK